MEVQSLLLTETTTGTCTCLYHSPLPRQLHQERSLPVRRLYFVALNGGPSMLPSEMQPSSSLPHGNGRHYRKLKVSSVAVEDLDMAV
jgi:hypothetical protein